MAAQHSRFPIAGFRGLQLSLPPVNKRSATSSPQPAAAANADILRYRHDVVARPLAPATINRRLAAIRSLTKLARLLGVVPWAIEVQDVPQETLRDTRGPGVETVAEMLRLAAAPRDSYAVRNVAMLRVMFDLALRVSEVRQLDVAEVPGFERASKIRGR